MTTHKRLRVLLVYANSPMDNLMPVSVSSLAGSLLREGFEVRLFDTTFYPWTNEAGGERSGSLQVAKFDYGQVGIEFIMTDVFEDFRSLVEDFNPQLIALSTVEPTHEFGIKLLNRVADMGIPTVVGGVFSIFSPDEVLREEAVDMVCVGEGETCLAKLCACLEDGRDHTGLSNLWVKLNGKIHKNPRMVEEIDNLPMLDFSVFDEKRIYRPMSGSLYRMLPIEFSRGCMYTCAYCSAPAYARIFKDSGRWLRFKSIPGIFDEIEHYMRAYDVEYFYFVSETFLGMPDDKFKEFCRRYGKIRIPFWFNTRPETITEEKVKMLEDIGCHRMSVGVECGNPEYSKTMLKRSVDSERIIKSCAIVSDSSIQLSVNNIIGFPDESREMIFQTIMLNRYIDAHSYSCSIFQPYRGTRLYDYCVEKGYIEAEKLCYDLTYSSPLLGQSVSSEELRGIARTFPLYVKLPEGLFDRIRVAEKFDEEGDRVFDELSEIYRLKYEKRSR
ncbi:MAG: B12-binding domain-containing radical SAM protein [Syntrophorhabdaceae bacterium]|nr:B12-binding domain-containing radical SAM protein [Syntrophorhabdaceae bacterium]